MSWRTNGPTIEKLSRRIEELERRVAALDGQHGGDWRILGDIAPRFRRDALNPALPAPMQPLPMFKPPAAPPRWDVATVRSASMTTGAMLALFSEGIVVVCLGFGLGMAWFVPIVVPAATLLFIAPTAWCLLTFTPWTILSIIEKKTGIDINGDKQIGDAPEAEPQRIELEVTSVNENGRVTGIKLIDVIGIPYDTLMEYFTAIVNGLQLTGPSWKGQTGSISQSKFTALMLALERAGLAENKRSNVGRVLTRAGKKILRRMVEPNPLPRKRGNVENE